MTIERRRTIAFIAAAIALWNLCAGLFSQVSPLSLLRLIAGLALLIFAIALAFWTRSGKWLVVRIVAVALIGLFSFAAALSSLVGDSLDRGVFYGSITVGLVCAMLAVIFIKQAMRKS